TWLTDIDIREYCSRHSPLLHGPEPTREVVFDEFFPPFYEKTRRTKLIQRFRTAINLAFKRSERVMILIAAHGFPEKGGYVILGGAKFHKAELDMLVPSSAFVDRAR